MIDPEEYITVVERMVKLFRQHSDMKYISDDELRATCCKLLNEWEELEWTLPDKPGVYLDNTNYPWVLEEDGSWTDHMGENRPAFYRFFLVNFGPWTRS